MAKENAELVAALSARASGTATRTKVTAIDVLAAAIGALVATNG
jgi:hypothetical protein